ncbi:cytochrome P460 family protein [Chelativorans xinjiangense]|uniref:cytochrome P460 family protein n=1 Tax=Chelativorans xinjiangense TaxID=2681485 RepID=UPI00135745D7|nr:cytochrome P460 family protein [Chelativorans xinjiangense]
MKLKQVSLGGIATVIIAAALVAHPQTAETQTQQFGGVDDLAYADALWAALAQAKLAGPEAMHSHFYEGTEPHGFVLEIFDSELSVNGHTGRVIVKNNYGPQGVDAMDVANDPAAHLAAVTVMFRREAGYDTDNKNWFWAKYLPNGSLDQNPAGMQLAGRVAKGADQGCIACHSAAPGEDYLFGTDRAD